MRVGQRSWYRKLSGLFLDHNNQNKPCGELRGTAHRPLRWKCSQYSQVHSAEKLDYLSKCVKSISASGNQAQS